MIKTLKLKQNKTNIYVNEVIKMREFWEELGSKDINNEFKLDKKSWKLFEEGRKNLWRKNYEEDYQVVERTKIKKITTPDGRTGKFKKVIVREQVFSPIEFYLDERLFRGCLNDEIKIYYDQFDSELIKLWKICSNRINFCMRNLDYSNELLKFCNWEVK